VLDHCTKGAVKMCFWRSWWGYKGSLDEKMEDGGKEKGGVSVSIGKERG